MPEFLNNFNLLPALPEDRESDEDPLKVEKRSYETDFSNDEELFDECEDEDGIKTDDEDNNEGFDRMSDPQLPIQSAISKPRFRIKTAVVRQQMLSSALDAHSREPYILPSVPDKFGFNRLYLPPIVKTKSIAKGKMPWIVLSILASMIILIAIVVPVVILTENKKSESKTSISQDNTKTKTTNIFTSTTPTTTTTITTTAPGRT